MAFVFRVYTGDSFTDHEPGDQTVFSVGSGKKDTLQISDMDLKNRHLEIRRDGDSWDFKAQKPILVAGTESMSGKLPPCEMLILDIQRKLAAALFETGPDYTTVADISGHGTVLIGRSASCDISIGSGMVSGRHLELRKAADGWHAYDMGSSNGTWVSGNRVREAALASGTAIDIGLCRLILTGDYLTISFAGPVSVNIAQNAEVKTAQQPDDEYPHLFKRSPRLMEELPSGEIEIQAAPNIGSKPEINWISVIIPSLAGVGVILTVSLLLGGPMTMLFFSAPTALIGIFMAIYNYKSQCKKYSGKENLRLVKYEDYLSDQETEIKSRIDAQRRMLNSIHPVTAECVAIVSEPARRLWERRPSDIDFMELRIGSGTVPSEVKLQVPKQQLTLEEDELSNRMYNLTDNYKTVDNCPITWHAGKNPTCGLIGDRAVCKAIAKNIILQAATHHSYEDLRIVTLFNKDELDDWEFVKWLPHSFDDTRSERYIINNPASAKRVLYKLEDILSQRNKTDEFSGYKNSLQTPFYLIICADESLLAREPVMKHLLSGDPTLGAGALFLYDEIDRLPKECAMLVNTAGKKREIYSRDNASVRMEFAPDTLRDGGCEAFARALSPVRIESSSGKGALPVSLTFLQGLNVIKPQEITSVAAWPQAQPETSMAVPVGQRAGGESFFFDIHEKQHGPHGLVAGMTGSGKSEMVQSWILSMALTFPPEAASFVLIDFKGTGLLLPFRNLPHLAGTISDLDTNITRNLIALENELNRRKDLFDENGVSNISGYLKLYRQGNADTPLSYLFIVIDEFAEFKVQFPEFMQVINRVFAIGRTLGVHIVLLTQKPAGVVDDKMNANTRFRWCLKVASSSDSKEMLRHPDAARITNPGRAFVQVGEDEVFEEIQSYWSGAPYNPLRDISAAPSVRLSVVNLYGQRSSYEPEKTTGFKSEQNEIDAIVEFLDEHTRKNDIPRAKNIWTNKMDADIRLDRILQIAFDGERWGETESRLNPAVGMIDDPRTQSQYPLRLDFADEGHIVVYGAPGTGKTTFLQTLIMSLALSYPPDNLSIYLMDFGGGSLNLFRNLPHIGVVARDTEEEKVEKLCKLISKEIDRRKALFSELGIVNINSYREASGDKMPCIMLILDNFAPVLNMYPDLDQFFQMLTRDGAGFGVYFVTTASNLSAVSYRITQNIKTGIALRMPDKMDYSSIVGRTDGMEPENLPGRGLIKGKPPLEFQTALPASGETENQRVARMKELIDLMADKWKGERPSAIQMLPETVRAADYKTQGLLAGLKADPIEPVEVDIQKAQFLLISCSGDADRADLTDAIAMQLPEIIPGEGFTLFDRSGEAKGACSVAGRHIADSGEFDEYIASLMPILQERRETSQSGGLNNPEHLRPIIIVIADVTDYSSSCSEETKKRMSNIVNLGIGLNVYVVASGRAEDIKEIYYKSEPFISAMITKATAVLGGGSFNSHGAFNCSLSYSEKAAELPQGYGYLLTGTNAEKIKCVVT